MIAKILNLQSTVSLKNVLLLWEQHDILILIIDLKDYSTLNADCLDDIEKEHLEKLQTAHFKKRFITSRTILKYVFCVLLNERSILDISLRKDKYGRLHVHNHDELNICISYTEDVVFLSISKIEVGIDVEKMRHLHFKKIPKFLEIETSCDGRSSNDLKILKAWTLKEAYCKFSNKSIFSYLNKSLNTSGICYSSYLINGKYLFTIVTNIYNYKINICYLEKNIV